MSNSWNCVTTKKPVSFEGKQVQMNSTCFHVGWLNFLESDGLWKPISSEFIKTGIGFEMKNAPFHVNAPLFADDYVTFYNNNRYDIFDKEIITDKPLEMRMKPVGVKHVEGKIVNNDLNMWNGLAPNVNYIIYEGAFGDYGDLIYYVDFGKAPRLCKLIKLNKEPPKKEFEFEVSYNEFP